MEIKIPSWLVWVIGGLLLFNLFPVMSVLVGLVLIGYWIGKKVNVSEAVERAKDALNAAADSIKNQPKKKTSKKKRK